MTTDDTAPALVARGRRLPTGRPLLMGVVNASTDSFSDQGEARSLDTQLAHALRLLDEGADVLDVGGQSAITNVPEIGVDVELARVLPLVEAVVAARPDAVVSVDTYRPEVVRAALGAGAAIVNDVSNLAYPEVAGLCAEAGAALVVMHTRARPKQRLQQADLYDDVVADVVDRVSASIEVARAHGLDERSIVVDPGVDFAKTPFQSIQLLRGIDRVAALGRPVLLALSRKDFVGALTLRPPAQRLAGSLGAVAAVGPRPGFLFRVHDVAATADLLTVLRALDGSLEVGPDLVLPDLIRHEARPG
ncbi:MAG: dihydropteroate synthase [Acidimicrobiia bacterium]